MTISEHAVRRGQQRGISQGHMELLFTYGQRKRRKGGAFALTLNRNGRKLLLQSNEQSRQVLDKLCHQVLICSLEGEVITAYHRN